VTTSRAALARMGSLAWDLALRIEPIAADAASSRNSPAGASSPSSARPPPPYVPAIWRSGSGSGHGARWIEPSRHHDHTSSVTKGRNGANSRSSTDRASRSAAIADPAGAGPKPPYARGLASSR